MTNKRDNIVIASEEDQYALTVFYPSSYHHENKLIVVYEDGFGDVELKIMTPKAIKKNYPVVEIEELEKFIAEREEKHDTE